MNSPTGKGDIQLSAQTQTQLRTKGAMIKVSNFVAGKWESGEERELRRLNPADQEDLVAVSPDSVRRHREKSNRRRYAGCGGMASDDTAGAWKNRPSRRADR